MTKKETKSSGAEEVTAATEDADTVTTKPVKKKLPELKVDEDGVYHVVMESEEQLFTLFGSESQAFCSAMMDHCINVSGSGEARSKDKNYALAIIAEVAPEDGLEAMLATQMAATHIAMMRHSRLMAGSELVHQLDLNERVYNKLARTFTTQMEALRKHRHGGKQTVTVQHVNVSDGGQAIVGNVKSGGGSS